MEEWSYEKRYKKKGCEGCSESSADFDQQDVRMAAGSA